MKPFNQKCIKFVRCLFSISLTELSAVLQEVVSVTVSTIHYSNAYHSINIIIQWL